MTEKNKVEPVEPTEPPNKDDLMGTPVEPVKPEPVEPKDEPTANELLEENKRLKAANKAVNAEAAQRRKKLEAFEKAEDERKKAEMSEIDRLKLEGEELAAENTKLKFEGQQTAIATEVGLPPAFADRIKGATPEEMKADAEALIAAMPVKPEANPKTTNPGDLALDGETLEQKNKRLGI